MPKIQTLSLGPLEAGAQDTETFPAPGSSLPGLWRYQKRWDLHWAV